MANITYDQTTQAAQVREIQDAYENAGGGQAGLIAALNQLRVQSEAMEQRHQAERIANWTYLVTNLKLGTPAGASAR